MCKNGTIAVKSKASSVIQTDRSSQPTAYLNGNSLIVCVDESKHTEQVGLDQHPS